MSTILIVSPHPDDDALGCGGTICRHVHDGDRVEAIFLTSGERGGHGLSPERTGPLREREATDAAAILGLSSIEFWRERNGEMRMSRALIERLQKKIVECRAVSVYVTHDREAHPEHRLAARLVRRAVDGLPKTASRPAVLMYEVWTPLQSMDQIVDISPYMEVKLAAIRAHRSQCEVLSFEQAIQGLNRYRGEMHSWPGGDYAEVFKLAGTQSGGGTR